MYTLCKKTVREKLSKIWLSDFASKMCISCRWTANDLLSTPGQMRKIFLSLSTICCYNVSTTIDMPRAKYLIFGRKLNLLSRILRETTVVLAMFCFVSFETV